MFWAFPVQRTLVYGFHQSSLILYNFCTGFLSLLFPLLPHSPCWSIPHSPLLRSQLCFSHPGVPLRVGCSPVPHSQCLLCPKNCLYCPPPLLQVLPRSPCLAFDSWRSLPNSVWQDSESPSASQEFLIHFYFWPTHQPEAVQFPNQFYENIWLSDLDLMPRHFIGYPELSVFLSKLFPFPLIFSLARRSQGFCPISHCFLSCS